ncbi:MAG: glycerophosphodiester phosphodiesterase family protein [Clostridia bacterium]
MITGYYQPPYPASYEQTLSVMQGMLDVAREKSQGLDLLVFPEYANAPGMTSIPVMKEHVKRVNQELMGEYQTAARNNRVNLCVNFLWEENDKFYNTTFLIGRDGEILAKYKKTHLSPTEIKEGLTPGSTPVFLMLENVKVTFAVCFELYFSEYFETLAIGKPDLILCPSYQRGEHADILMAQASVRALDCEAHVIRASYSMGKAKDTGGHSAIFNPYGHALSSAGQKTGLFTVDIDPRQKRIRPASYGEPALTSREIIETYRVESLYRKNLSLLDRGKYPRICAHRGLSVACPENTLPSFGAAVALGAQEIEFDVCPSKDGHLVVIHDSSLDRTTDGTGNVEDLTWAQINQADAGIKHGEIWKGVRVPLAEEVFRLFANRVIMNIHIKDSCANGYVVGKIIEMAYRYGNVDTIYISGGRHVLAQALALDPGIERNCLERQGDGGILEWADKFQCRRLQFFTNYTDEMVKKAKEMNMICNLFYADSVPEAKKAFSRGIDTVLTNHAGILLNAID